MYLPVTFLKGFVVVSAQLSPASALFFWYRLSARFSMLSTKNDRKSVLLRNYHSRGGSRNLPAGGGELGSKYIFEVWSSLEEISKLHRVHINQACSFLLSSYRPLNLTHFIHLLIRSVFEHPETFRAHFG